MPELRDARSIIENAEQAAAAGNYSSAEELLREAAALQEQTLGPHHPDLANTLNNLGVVCEMTDNPIDAEHYFRRAYRIATATLALDHPFVVTSRKNLHDFCAARGRPAELRPSRPEVAAWLEAPAQRAAPPRESSTSAKKQDVTPIPRKRSLRPFALGALGGGALHRDSHDDAALGQWDRGDQVASGDRHSSSTRDFSPESNASAGQSDCWTATDREAAAHPKRGRRGQRQAKHAHEIGRDANGGHGAALHRPPGMAMRSCGQSGSTRTDVLLHAGQIRNRHHD